ncbi:General transcription factor IIH subunit 2 [Wickerhamomyces ciferrii]|uniref:General transcription and DNA repair factor IIH n=1 Tax=Wickerhamomyces ciferrii (strain ATCC 14091 / BCRC 22168 / CBS 111 / JCM 3599 / NBRC 0793 / NRRL Y-1031 F-60-10) TaxID=1206466 RepID=K0KLD3_WICCF|nr:General transcription factor IIH subunit 2 [Wickerhamomyces ciferrii]CCH43771.1 General transcription factor IIH subunit 2 [Wickerhamomyces ciferrii]
MDESEDEFIDRLNSEDEASGVANRTRRKAVKATEIQGANGGYSWEDEYQRSWDIVKEDEAGSIAGIVSGLLQHQKKRIIKNVTPFQRGIIRNLILILDLSSSMLEKDLRPNRHSITITNAIQFVTEFFDQNPISQLGIIIMRNGIGQLVSQVGGNPQEHIDALKSIKKLEPKGDPSLQNALEMSRGLLMHVASHCTREVLIIYGSLLSLDPGNIHKTVNSLVEEKIRVKIIGLSAQVSICKEICKKTNFGDENSYNVILNEQHFKELFMDAVVPLPVNKINKSFTLVKMGFPYRISEDSPSFCSCHSKLTYGGYICPNCKSKICSLPTICPCCNTMLILSTHLARSYHHLLPLKNFIEVPVDKNYDVNLCFGCQMELPDGLITQTSSSRYKCVDCNNQFCIDCDVFIHETLHNCPGCENS